MTFEISLEDKLEDLIAEDNLFFEPYQELWKKILGTTFYIIEVFAGLLIIALIKYESGGHAGNFRTAFNQLNSWKHIIVSIEILLSTYVQVTANKIIHPIFKIGLYLHILGKRS